MFNFTPAVKVLLIANVAVHLLTSLVGPGLSNLLAMHDIMSPQFYPWQPITYMFAHGGFMHLLSNMIGLIVFGPMLEGVWGEKRFYQFYFITGLGAMLLYSGINFFEMRALESKAEAFYAEPSAENLNHFIKDHGGSYYRNPDYIRFRELYAEHAEDKSMKQEATQLIAQIESVNLNRPMLGASGAVLGVVGAFGLLFPNTMLMLLFPPIPIKAKYIVMAYAAIDIYGIVVDAPEDNVAHFAHIGGLLVGWLVVVIWHKDRENFF